MQRGHQQIVCPQTDCHGGQQTGAETADKSTEDDRQYEHVQQWPTLGTLSHAFAQQQRSQADRQRKAVGQPGGIAPGDQTGSQRLGKALPAIAMPGRHGTQGKQQQSGREEDVEHAFDRRQPQQCLALQHQPEQMVGEENPGQSAEDVAQSGPQDEAVSRTGFHHAMPSFYCPGSGGPHVCRPTCPWSSMAVV